MNTARQAAVPQPATGWKIAVIGAGPAGLALALQAARRLPGADITLFDARPIDRDVSGDPRALALSQGSVQWLQALGAWPAAQAQPILQVQVSQVPPTWAPGGRPAQVLLRAAEAGVPQFGAVLHYGTLVWALQQAWLARAQAEPARLHSRFGLPVAAIKPLADAVEVDAGTAERFDLAVVAEGGVFADQARKAVSRDYRQTAWVGTVTLADAVPGLAVERFTHEGPLALLPLPAGAGAAPAGTTRAALVWCVAAGDPASADGTPADDTVSALGDAQRIAVLNRLLPDGVGRVVGLSPLKRFALGLNAERTLVDGRTVRIGNAAQTLHPVAGQGLNLGLRDAATLVQALRQASAEQLPAVLRRLEWQRGPDRWSMIAATDFLARSFTWQVPGLALARGLGLAALQAMPAARGALARQMMFGRR